VHINFSGAHIFLCTQYFLYRSSIIFLRQCYFMGLSSTNISTNNVHGIITNQWQLWRKILPPRYLQMENMTQHLIIQFSRKRFFLLHKVIPSSLCKKDMFWSYKF
jgi:hypothetical protein